MILSDYDGLLIKVWYRNCLCMWLVLILINEKKSVVYLLEEYGCVVVYSYFLYEVI